MDGSDHAAVAPGRGQPSLRARRRVRDMESVQRRAVALFTTEGFDDVSVERVAAAAGVSPVSIYRWFGSKEALVLWDDFDPPLLEAIASRLHDTGPLEAVRRGVVDELAHFEDRDHDLVLARTTLIHREPALLAASTHGMRALEEAIAAVFERAGLGQDALQRRTWAAVAVAALRAAVDTWQRREGRDALGDIVTRAFHDLEVVPWTT